MLDRIISFSFYLLFLLTPLIWTPFNFELFEYNKMIFVYLLTIIIAGAWLLKTINQKSLILNRTPLDIPILLFLGANILSTLSSIDTHTSIWGYYSRSNGGLLSIICYTLLYFAFTANIAKDQALKVLKMGLWGGLLVALWAIPEHFGASPSCLILRGELTADCWVQDVAARVFATLGQPNWLASYLSMLIFPTLYFLAVSPRIISENVLAYVTDEDDFLNIHPTFLNLAFLWIIPAILYLAFTFTYSRSGFFGAIVGIVVFFALSFFKDRLHSKKVKFGEFLSSYILVMKPALIIIGVFLAINIYFGSALTRFNLSQLTDQPAETMTNKPSTSTQLESGGTESGQIRLIVWQGALDIFKHYPIFGSGVETFAISYYQFRPAAHNLVSEWDFLYNKAHNELLNYLANTGLVGLGTYLSITVILCFWAIKKRTLLSASILGSVVCFHVQNFFGFSVVVTNLLFYLLPAIAFVASDSLKPLFPKKPATSYQLLATVRPIYVRSLQIFLLLTTIFLLLTTLRFWYADTLFAIGQRNDQSGNAGKAYNYLISAVELNKNEPFYRSELGYTAASAALALHETDATLSGQLKDEAVAETEAVLQTNPKNVSFHRTAIRTYYQLADIDEEYTQKTLDMIDKTIVLAPTDPKLYYNKAIILGQVDRVDVAIEVLKKAIELKSNYTEAYFALSLFHFDQDRPLDAVETMQKVLQLDPTNPGALEQLNQWGKQGIATQSAKI